METVKRWIADWKFPTTVLCVYGFFSTVKPMEPFLYLYMNGPDKNLTEAQINNEVFPLWTYCYLVLLVPVFLLTDWLRYKPVVVCQSLSLFTTTALLRWAYGVPGMQSTQVFYALVTSCEVAYFSYIYSMIDLKRYRKATSYCRSVQLLGYTTGSLLGQLLTSFELMSYNNMMVLTLVLTSIAVLTSFFLPMPQHSMFFHHKHTAQKAARDVGEHEYGTGDATEQASGSAVSAGNRLAIKRPEVQELEVGKESCGKVLLRLLRDFRECYSSRQLLYWSVWWAMATCGYNQTVNYVQILWEHVEPQNFSSYNGVVEAASNLFGAATAYGIGFTEVRWDQWGELALGGFSGLGGATLFLMTFIDNIFVCYVTYVIFKCLYMLLITIAMFQIAVDLSMERYALVFGANNFGALALQTILTAVVVDKRGLGLDILSQFTIYASYFSAIAVVFLLRGLYTISKIHRNKKGSTPPVENEPPDFGEHRF
ncbi:thiamine transporter 1 [Chaetodon trifascialis]|uniref:thiamine transporter 1 n=1 Tax=Chaetodon trifascialis TaxID=109706 RepID=UPI003994D75C